MLLLSHFSSPKRIISIRKGPSYFPHCQSVIPFSMLFKVVHKCDYTGETNILPLSGPKTFSPNFATPVYAWWALLPHSLSLCQPLIAPWCDADTSWKNKHLLYLLPLSSAFIIRASAGEATGKRDPGSSRLKLPSLFPARPSAQQTNRKHREVGTAKGSSADLPPAYS